MHNFSSKLSEWQTTWPLLIWLCANRQCFFVFVFLGRLVELPDSSGGAAIGSGKTKGWAKLSSSFMA